MKRIMTRFFTCLMVCAGLFIGYISDAMAIRLCVAYYCMDGTGDAPDVQYGEACEVAANTCTPPSGMAFSGWHVETVGSVVQPGDTLYTLGGEPVECDGVFGLGYNLFAQYEPAGATYTVTYSCNGGTGTVPANATATENQSFTPAANTCSKSGYVFTGWAVSGTNDVKQAGTAFTWNYDENKTLTAQWARTYNVSYLCGAGTGTPPTSTTVTENTSFTPAANTCGVSSGYSGFAGWLVSGTNDVKPAGTAFNWTYNTDKTLTAQWTGNTISVNWYDGEDELTGANVAGSCTYGSTFNVPTPTSRTGYVFTGWKVMVPQTIDLTTVVPSGSATGYGYDIGGGSYYISNSCNVTAEEITTFGKWAMCFDSGSAIGESLCSSSTGTYGRIGTPNESSSGNECWCKITAFKPTSGTATAATTSYWVYLGNIAGDPYYDCDFDCEGNCFMSGPGYKNALFGITQ